VIVENLLKDMSNPLTFKTMQPLLNEQFVLHRDSTQAIDIELVEVTPIQKNKQYSWQKEEIPSKREAFTLVFRTPCDLEPTQKMYEITHSQFGDLGLIFLVPITQDEEGLYFEAVFT
jgi:hypothetical protein